MRHLPRTFLAIFFLAAVSSSLVPVSHATESPAAAVGYSISAAPTSLTIQRGSSAASTITLRSHNFVGTVSLSAVVVPHGPSATINPSTVLLAISTGATSKLTVSTTSTTAPGNYVVKVNATDITGLITHGTEVVVTVPGPDFTINPSPTSLTLPADTNASATITVSSLNSFTGAVQLTAISPSTMLNTTLDPTSVQLSAGGVSTSTLWVYTSCATPVVNYSVQVMGASMSIGAHTIQITVTVEDSPSCHSSPNPPPNPSPSPPPGPSPGTSQSPKLPRSSNELLLGNALTALAIVVAVAAAMLVFRRLWPAKWAGLRTGM
ncbi:hypothetical protein J2P12_02210 [Candidatus Bathyarchaeota archaeon]|nr:hypothetical protein [Candidatus Bathyarchaeota archaeon]